MHASTLRSFCALLLLCGVAACGADHQAAGAANAAGAAGGTGPTPDEMRAAQSSTQSASDGSDGAANTTSPSTSRAATGAATASGSVGLTAQRGHCFAQARALGGNLLTQPTQYQAVSAALGHVKGPLSTSTSVTAAAQAGAVSSTRLVDDAPFASLRGASALPALPKLPTAGANPTSTPLVFDPASCALGHSTLSGWEVVQTATTAAGLPSLQVVGNLLWKLASGATIAVTSADANYPTFEVDLEAGSTAAARTLDIYVNEHRVRTAASGTVDIDVVTQTLAGTPTKVAETLAASAQSAQGTSASSSAQASVQARTLVSGSVKVTHNLAHFVGTHTYNNLHFDLSGACSCPVSGSLSQTAIASDGSRQASHAYTFTGCGTATVVSEVTTKHGKSSATGQISFENCQ